VPFVDPSAMVQGAPLPGWSGRFFHSDKMTFAYWDIAAGAQDLHEHHHPQEEVWHVIEGAVLLKVGGEEQRVGAGAAAVVPSNAPHAVRVLGSCRAIVVDCPVRDQLPGVRDA
jgi:mannose-6-phosphate isomerase-like protein (cupin superfamily)